MTVPRAFSSYRQLATATLWVLGWVIAINALLLLLAQTPAMNWLPDRQTGTGFVLENKERVQGAVAEYQAGRVAPDTYLIAVTGISNVREGVDLATLREKLGKNVRVLGVAGAGLGAPSIVENAETILASPLRPDLVLLGVAPLQMLDPSTGKSVSAADLPAPPLRERIRALAGRYVWLFARRNDISLFSERMLLRVREIIFGALDVHEKSNGADDPWRPMRRLMGADHFNDKAVQSGLNFAGSLGAFDPASYARAQQAPLMISGLVKHFNDRKSRVIIFLTPEHSRLRQREPAGVLQIIAARLRDEGLPTSSEILDFRNAVSDDGFADLVHLNKGGSVAFSKLLSAKVSADMTALHPSAARSQSVASSIRRTESAGEVSLTGAVADR